MQKRLIEKKINTVIRQYELTPNYAVYIPKLLKLEEQLFSSNVELRAEAIRKVKSLLLTLRAWDSIDDTFRGKPFDINKNDFKENFVDDFNNFNEWYEFLKGLVKDLEEYHEERSKSGRT